jgi:hypothetical protein
MSNRKKTVKNGESKNIRWRFFGFFIVFISILFCLAFYLNGKIEIERNGLERKEFERNGLERKEFERKETLDFSNRKEIERKEIERKETLDFSNRKEFERNGLERKEFERKETLDFSNRKEIERKEIERKETLDFSNRKEFERNGLERKEFERKEFERKETLDFSNRKEIERKEIERKEIERKEIERKEIERKEFERKETLDFSDIRIGLTPFIDQIPVSEGSKKYKAAMIVLRIHPNHLASLFAAGESCQTLLDFEQSYEFFSKFLSISPENRIVQISKNESEEKMKRTIKRVKEIEIEMKSLPKSKFYYKWKPIQELGHPWMTFHPKIKEIKEIVIETKKNATKMEMIKRLWAVETGRVENIYDLTEGAIKTLIIDGINAASITSDYQKRLEPDQYIVAWEYATIMNDQFKVIEDIYNGIKNRNITLDLNLIFEMHKVFTETACFTETSLFGNRIKVLIRRGKFKNIPNSPMRSDGLWHEYCPVS